MGAVERMTDDLSQTGLGEETPPSEHIVNHFIRRRTECSCLRTLSRETSMVSTTSNHPITVTPNNDSATTNIASMCSHAASSIPQ